MLQLLTEAESICLLHLLSDLMGEQQLATDWTKGCFSCRQNLYLAGESLMILNWLVLAINIWIMLWNLEYIIFIIIEMHWLQCIFPLSYSIISLSSSAALLPGLQHGDQHRDPGCDGRHPGQWWRLSHNWRKGTEEISRQWIVQSSVSVSPMIN